MSKQIEALKLALEALKLNCSSQTESPATKAITAIREALAEQPAQQPVAWMDAEGDVYKEEPPDGWCPPHTPLYTSPPAIKPWVGLTDEDTYEATGTAGTDLLALAKLWSDNKIHVYQFDNEARKIIEAVLRRASAKLREKNNG